MRIVIGEDSALFREGLAALLESAGHVVVARHDNGDDVVHSALSLLPEIVILDIRLPHETEGIAAALAIRAEKPQMPIMLLSQHVEANRAIDLVQTGAIGYLLKDRVLDVDEFLATLERVAGGGAALDQEVVMRLLGAARASTILAELTQRELDVLALMAEGWSNRAIARRLSLSERTIETHIGSIFMKLALGDSPDGHRRVRAILAYLKASPR